MLERDRLSSELTAAEQRLGDVAKEERARLEQRIERIRTRLAAIEEESIALESEDVTPV